MGTKRKFRKTLTLEDRVNVIDMKDKGETAIAISKRLDCGKTQIQNIIRNKDSIMTLWRSGDGRPTQKTVKIRKITYPEVDKLVWDWYCLARAKNIPVSGRMIRQQARKYSLKLGHDGFKASNGWLQSFQSRHDIGESALSRPLPLPGNDVDVKIESATEEISMARVCDKTVKKEDANDVDDEPPNMPKPVLSAADVNIETVTVDIPMARACEKTVKEEKADYVDDDDEPPKPVLSAAKVYDIINGGIDFAMFHGNAKLLNHLSRASNELLDMQWRKTTTQKTIGQFFTPTAVSDINNHDR